MSINRNTRSMNIQILFGFVVIVLIDNLDGRFLLVKVENTDIDDGTDKEARLGDPSNRRRILRPIKSKNY